MDRFSTSFPLSSELPLHGGLSQHDLSVRISRSRGVLRCAYSTYAFRDVGPSVFSFDRLKDPSFCFMPLPFPESQALNTHSVEFSSRLPSSPSIKSDSAKRSYPPSSALSCRITSDTDLRLPGINRSASKKTHSGCETTIGPFVEAGRGSMRRVVRRNTYLRLP